MPASAGQRRCSRDTLATRGRRARRLVFVGAVALWVVACGGPDRDPGPDARIRNAIAVGERAAEQRDLGVLKTLVAPDYADDRGHDRRSIVRLVQVYLLRHRAIHLFSRIVDLTVIDPQRAESSMVVAMAGRHIETADQLWDVRAEVMRFDLVWRRTEGEWKVVKASWQRAGVEDFFPD